MPPAKVPFDPIYMSISILFLSRKSIVTRGLKREAHTDRNYYGILQSMSSRFDTLFGH